MKATLFGINGAGKGRQTGLVAAAYDLDVVSTGTFLRAARASGSELGKQAAPYMDAGELVPDELVNPIVAEGLGRLNNFMLDGYPRNLRQAQFLDDMGIYFDAAGLLVLSEKDALERAAARSECASCRLTYGRDRTPSEEGKCDNCHSDLTKREDDRWDVVRARFRIYETETVPVIGFYEGKGVLHRVEAKGTPEQVFARIKSYLDGFRA